MPNNQNIKIAKYAQIFKALSNPNRLKIFFSLATCCKPGTVGIFDASKTACVGAIGEDLDIVASTVSHHIKELRHAGLIKTIRRGQNIECWVDPGILEELKTFFSF
jgi:DNA-binding transcriptional ArsR family regulator